MKKPLMTVGMVEETGVKDRCETDRDWETNPA